MKERTTSNEYLNTFAKTSFFVFLSLVLSKVLTYGYKIIIARNFGTSTYGNFSLAIIITGFFVAFASLGFSDGIVRYISYYIGRKDNVRIKYILSLASRVALFSGICGGIVLFLLADIIAINFFGNEELAFFLRAFSLVVPLSLIANVFIAALRSYERAKTASFLVGTFQNTVRLALIGGFIVLGLGLSSLFYSYVLSYVALIIVALYFSHDRFAIVRRAQHLIAKERKKLFGELFAYSWPLAFVGLLLSMFYWTDSLILGYFTDSNIVGLYNAAITLVGLFVMAPDLFSQLFLPVVSKELSRNNREVIRTITKQITKWIYTINIPVFALLFIFPGILLDLLFGAEFRGAENTLRVLALGGLFSGFLNTFTNLLSAKKETKLILYNFIFFSIFNVVLGLLFIRYGMVGIASATTLSWIGFCLVLFFEIKKKYGFYPLKRSIIKITLVGIAPFLLTLGIATIGGQTLGTLIAGGIIFGSIYSVLLLATKSFDENDWEIIKDIRTKVFQLKSMPFQKIEQS